jgi:hypothetical protein
VVEYSTTDHEIRGLNPGGAWHKEKMADSQRRKNLHKVENSYKMFLKVAKS